MARNSSIISCAVAGSSPSSRPVSTDADGCCTARVAPATLGAFGGRGTRLVTFAGVPHEQPTFANAS